MGALGIELRIVDYSESGVLTTIHYIGLLNPDHQITWANCPLVAVNTNGLNGNRFTINHFVAARRSYSFYRGNCHRIRVGLAGERSKHFWNQLSNFLNDKEMENMCKWGANVNSWLAMALARSRTPTSPTLWGPKSATTD